MSGEQLGHGTYGMVVKEGDYAVKSFKLLKHMIQEWCVSNILDDSPLIVQMIDYNLENLSVRMKCYDMSLKDFLADYKKHLKFETRVDIFKDILSGLSHMHQKNMIHADLKPGNILVSLDDNRVAIADLGFVSFAQYARVKQTTKLYSEINAVQSPAHDIYSLGIITLELFSDFRPRKQYTSDELQELCQIYLKGKKKSKIRRFCLQCFSPVKVRPTSSQLLYDLFEIKITPKIPLYIEQMQVPKKGKSIVHCAEWGTKYQIRQRCKRAFKSVMHIMSSKGYAAVETNLFDSYMLVMLFIHSALFRGRMQFEDLIKEEAKLGVNKAKVMQILKEILDDKELIKFNLVL